MELTPKLLTTVEFAEKRRGYDPDEVRAFLAEVAKSMDALQGRVREAEARAADAKAAPAGPSAEEVAEQARRTLVLAQRTADAAVAEAKDEAERTRADANTYAATERAAADADAAGAKERAQAFAERALRDAQERATQLLADTDAQARAESVEVREALRREIEGLTAARDTLRGDIERLEAYLSAQRERIRTSIDAMQHVLDHPEALAASEPPPDSAFTVPEPTPPTEPIAPPLPPATDAIEAMPAPGEDADADRSTADRSSDGADLDATMAVPRVESEPGDGHAPDPTPPAGMARPDAGEVTAPADHVPEPPGGRDDGATVASPRPNGPSPDAHDPLLSGEPEPFDDEQLVRSFFDPKRPEGWRRRRRE